MIKNYAKGFEYLSPTIEKMLNTPPYEKERAEALKWFQENLLSPVVDHRAGYVSRVHTSDDRVLVMTVGSLCGLSVQTHASNSPGDISVMKTFQLTPKVMRELASALLVCAERAEHPTRMIVEK